ncbi:uncharacterized protein LACBIDRAFT_314385 [Laccaria bicolor S238N-H82]|uniref:Predicted protein n=1 Tax=Laccaria bicolor (strain S238N-H82 / ATCC MYA-4686) TaxID=486041 RepID=B0DYF6_LACBS|nr:uncharacterized protein LACBIDRAFT_314385 [Laccaria bicolor S238N-H82]EDR00428.1 predicted protein [Laccaria bicolor S238N-H82]|eukprot:XP_001888987.1 predicted protein [Laccaria bicolor S238N-H82]
MPPITSHSVDYTLLSHHSSASAPSRTCRQPRSFIRNSSTSRGRSSIPRGFRDLNAGPGVG